MSCIVIDPGDGVPARVQYRGRMTRAAKRALQEMILAARRDLAMKAIERMEPGERLAFVRAFNALTPAQAKAAAQKKGPR